MKIRFIIYFVLAFAIAGLSVPFLAHHEKKAIMEAKKEAIRAETQLVEKHMARVAALVDGPMPGKDVEYKEYQQQVNGGLSIIKKRRLEIEADTLTAK